jgi:molybdate transport system substrate-binding protein
VTPDRTRRAGVLVLIGLLLAACGALPGSDQAGSTGQARQTLVVLAAASLTATFTELGDLFEQQHPGVAVTFGFAGSSDLVAQLQQGAGGDVLATADDSTMQRASADGLIASAAVPFATNSMTIAVPPGNPAGVTSFADLASPGVAVVVCAPQVPCGAATQRVQEASGVTLSPVSEESSVTDVLGKVTSGEADAGVVYVTDVRTAGEKVDSVGIAAGVNTTTTYPLAVLAGSTEPGLARDFVDLVLSAPGRRVLGDAGFSAP